MEIPAMLVASPTRTQLGRGRSINSDEDSPRIRSRKRARPSLVDLTTSDSEDDFDLESIPQAIAKRALHSPSTSRETGFHGSKTKTILPFKGKGKHPVKAKWKSSSSASPGLQAKRLFDEQQPSVDELLAMDQCLPSLKYSDTCTHNGHPYTEQQMDHLKLCLEKINNLGSFFVDFIDILRLGVSQGRYIPTNILQSIVCASLKWQHEERLHSLYFFLQQDLGLRPIGSLDKSILSQMLQVCITSLEAALSQEADSPSCSSERQTLSTACLLLARFITTSLLQSLGHIADHRLPLIPRVLKHRTIVKLVDVTFLVVNSRLCREFTLFSAIQHQLLVLLCLPLAASQRRSLVNEISQEFANHFMHVESWESKRQLLLQIPSEILRENLLERLLEVEFSLHPSARHFENTNTMQNSPMSLSKFCCVHLCRVPYHPSSEEPGNISYFLSLLCYLLQSHILCLTGTLPVTLPGLEYCVPRSTCNSDELQASLASVKPHIAGLVDRISEDERLLTSLVLPECWMYLQLLGNLTEPGVVC